ncbi:MAG: N-acetylmuramoyl-L-alanine amidase, partial [Clostridia bacterium]|nr:N-acetylmuramoyl-L-alanine amidase [Clostridia bacterium]
FVIDKKAICAVVAVIFICILVLSVPLIASATETKNERVIVIDAGHGGLDGGVVGAETNVKESDLNLEIATLVGEYLESFGFKVVQTRKNKGALTAGKFNKKKDMQKRVSIINDASPVCAISIHLNSFLRQKSRRGAQVFFDADSDDGRQLALSVQRELNTINNEYAKNAYSPLSADKYLFWNVKVPIVIVECGFLSNHYDELNLQKSNYQHIISSAIARGVVAFLSA